MHSDRGEKNMNAYSRWLLRVGSASGLLVTSFAARAVPCAGLTGLALPHTTVTSAVQVAATSTVPTYCLVEAHAKPTSDSDIKILVGLPTAANWNGRFVQSGNGGFAGSVAPPTGSVQLGYAGAATDDGHTGSGFDASWALGHPEKVIDFGYRALKETTNTAKALIAAFYGASPRYSYFSGCSDGGREALQEAQRYPGDWDGIVVGAPANFWTHHFTGFVFNQQVLANTPIAAAKLPAIQAAAVAQCDASDGVVDGVVENPQSCRFDPGRMLCGDEQLSHPGPGHCGPRVDERSPRPAHGAGDLSGLRVQCGQRSELSRTGRLAVHRRSGLWSRAAGAIRLRRSVLRLHGVREPGLELRHAQLHDRRGFRGREACRDPEFDQYGSERDRGARREDDHVSRLGRRGDFAVQYDQLLPIRRRNAAARARSWRGRGSGRPAADAGLLPALHGAGHVALWRRSGAQHLRLAGGAGELGRARAGARADHRDQVRERQSGERCGANASALCLPGSRCLEAPRQHGQRFKLRVQRAEGRLGLGRTILAFAPWRTP